MKTGTAGMTFSGPSFIVDESVGALRGANLFHSFQRFSINPGQVATFTAASRVDNVLARVTGTEASSIEGTLRSSITGANFFLINPRGLIFGPNAVIDVKGSFVGTTADYVGFEDGSRFSAKLSEPPPLTVAAPSAFGFLPENQGKISVLSNDLRVPAGQTLSFVGGDVELNGAQVSAPGGAVQIVSAKAGAAAGEVKVPVDGRAVPVFSPGLGRGTVAVNQSAISLDASARKVVIRGGRLTFADSQVGVTASAPGDGLSVAATGSLSSNNSAMFALVDGDLGAGNAAIDIKAKTAALTNGSLIASDSGTSGANGHVAIAVEGELVLSGVSAIASDAATAKSGDVRIRAGSVRVDSDAFIGVSAGDEGVTGDLLIEAVRDVTIASGGELSLAQSPKAPSRLFISARDLLIAGDGGGSFTGIIANLFADTGNPGGAVELKLSGRLTVRDGGIIEADSIGGNGARVSVQAAEVVFDGGRTLAATGISATHSGPLSSQAGMVSVRATGGVSLLNGASISTNTLDGGPGGRIDIRAATVTVEGRSGASEGVAQGITSRNESDGLSGPGGDIAIRAPGGLSLRRGGQILATASGSGRGGNITISGGNVTLTDRSTISAATMSKTGGGPGGSVTIEQGGVLRVEGGSKISVATFGSGRGGDANLQVSALRVSGDGSSIAATTAGSGAGGNLTIRTGALEVTQGGRISASTCGPGIGGTVDVRARNLEISGTGSTISSQSLMRATGAAGDLDIAARTITLRDGATIAVSSAGFGAAGTMSVTASDRILLTGGSALTGSAPFSTGGNLDIVAGRRIDLEDSRIEASAATRGGNISVVTRDILNLEDSQITAAARTDGGNIFIDPQFVILDHSIISADAIYGRGGNIDIVADFLIASPDSRISASSRFGLAGSVRIDAIYIDLTGNLTELQTEIVRAEALLRALCTVKLRDFSSLIMEGQGGLAPAPDEGLPSYEAWPLQTLNTRMPQ